MEVDVVARLGPDDLQAWREIVVLLNALNDARVELAQAVPVHERRLAFMVRAYEVYGLKGGRSYNFCPFTGVITAYD